ncbi:MAG: sulfatase-like hydrolase/transferase [Phycisphaeraceae bacterium]|nr:sulfatase-like hydrolase/transferase [Phycisphaeraceae bacterium]
MNKRPNILFLFTDQQRFDTIAALGNPIIKTPTMDRLVREGTTFTRAYTPSPVCVSARCSLVTGLPPHQNGCWDNMNMRQDLPSFMDKLTATGYQTHGVGKMHFTPTASRMWGFESRNISEEGAGKDDSFCEFLVKNDYSHVHAPHGVRSEYYYIPQPSQLPAHLHHTAWTADRSIDFINQRDTTKPFFLWSSFIKPHPPFESPTPWSMLYRTSEMPEPNRFEGMEDLQTYWNHAQNRYKYKDGGYDAQLMRTMKAAYYSCISFIDYQMGRIIETLGDEIDNTLILLSADHGELLGDYGSVGKRCMLDAANRVPMIVRYPKNFKAGTRCNVPVSLVDVYPTFLSTAECDNPVICNEGAPLNHIADGKTDRDATFSQFQTGSYGLYMITTESHKYIYSVADKRELFFDLQNDPKETRNLATDPSQQAVFENLKQRLIQRMSEGDDQNLIVTNGQWTAYEGHNMPDDPNAGLLYQDPQGTQELVDALGPDYAHTITKPGKESSAMIRTSDRHQPLSQ